MKDLEDIEAEKKKKKKFTESLETYLEGGIKGLFESLKKEELVKEEPDNETFTKEVEENKKKEAKSPSNPKTPTKSLKSWALFSICGLKFCGIQLTAKAEPKNNPIEWVSVPK